jgi:hypothetical protein
MAANKGLMNDVKKSQLEISFTFPFIKDNPNPTAGTRQRKWTCLSVWRIISAAYLQPPQTEEGLPNIVYKPPE